MRAKFVNEIRQNKEESGLGSIGIGSVAYNRGFVKIKKMLGPDAGMFIEMTDFNVIKEHEIEIIKPYIQEALNCALDNMLFVPRDFFPTNVYLFLENEVFSRLSDDENFIRFTHIPKKIFNEGEYTGYTTRIECWTTSEWGVIQIIVYKEHIKTFERTGDVYYCIRYK